MTTRGAWLVLGMAAACGGDHRAWEAELAASEAERLTGAWELRLETADSRSLVGFLAFTLNEERLHGNGPSGPPMLFGTWSMDFAALGLAVGIGADVPEVAATVRSDTVSLILSPESRLPMELRGLLQGDSVAGTWLMTSRARPTVEGTFVMKRR
jgi:hypothetical protein